MINEPVGPLFKFQNGSSRALKQKQGYSEQGVLWNYTGHMAMKLVHPEEIASERRHPLQSSPKSSNGTTKIQGTTLGLTVQMSVVPWKTRLEAFPQSVLIPRKISWFWCDSEKHRGLNKDVVDILTIWEEGCRLRVRKLSYFKEIKKLICFAHFSL